MQDGQRQSPGAAALRLEEGSSQWSASPRAEGCLPIAALCCSELPFCGRGWTRATALHSLIPGPLAPGCPSLSSRRARIPSGTGPWPVLGPVATRVWDAQPDTVPDLTRPQFSRASSPPLPSSRGNSPPEAGGLGACCLPVLPSQPAAALSLTVLLCETNSKAA